METRTILFSGKTLTITSNDMSHSITTYACPECQNKMISLKQMLMVGVCQSCRWIKKIDISIEATIKNYIRRLHETIRKVEDENDAVAIDIKAGDLQTRPDGSSFAIIKFKAVPRSYYDNKIDNLIKYRRDDRGTL